MESNPSKIYKCNICNKIYSARQNLWKHNQHFHKDNDDVCDTVIPQKTTKNHKKMQIL
jgi:hypothetical protein